MKQPAVYILSNGARGTLYVGVTSDLRRRVWTHREGALEGFSKRHGLKRLVWFELVDEIAVAIEREKQIKNWRRAWKLRLIEEENPAWRDLWSDIAGW